MENCQVVTKLLIPSISLCYGKRWVPAIFHPLKRNVLGGPIPSAYRAVGACLPSRELGRFSRREVHCRRKWGTGLNEVC